MLRKKEKEEKICPLVCVQGGTPAYRSLSNPTSKAKKRRGKEQIAYCFFACVVALSSVRRDRGFRANEHVESRNASAVVLRFSAVEGESFQQVLRRPGYDKLRRRLKMLSIVLIAVTIVERP